MNSASLAISRCNCNCGVVLWAFSTPVNTCRSSSINWYFNIITPACLSTYKCRCPFIMSERVIIIHLVTDPHLSPVVPLSCGLDSAAYCLGEVFFFFFFFPSISSHLFFHCSSPSVTLQLLANKSSDRLQLSVTHSAALTLLLTSICYLTLSLSLFLHHPHLSISLTAFSLFSDITTYSVYIYIFFFFPSYF